jgi:CelD/BcsL family acetyltransferase involved in cellulose biosynthesis/glycosyltransferase involved in cell wall biosynthesis
MKHTVLSVAYPLAPVGPDAVGGSEQVLSLLDAALIEAGYRSVVVACEGSEVKGELITSGNPDGPLDGESAARAIELHRKAVERALREDVDLVHFHAFDFERYLPPPGKPVLVTLHMPPEWYNPEIFHIARPDTFLHCVSSTQRRRCPPEADVLPEVIENGVPVERFATRAHKRNYAVAFGRVCPEKGFHLALDAAKLADIPLLIGGAVFSDEVHIRYFEEMVQPRLTGRNRFLGPVGFDRKRRLLSGARCLLVPSLAPETSSLVAMEALACGTPVIAFPSGALAEIVEPGKTGFLVENEKQMAEAIHAVRDLSPEECRRVARERFSADRMVNHYMEAYERLMYRRAPIVIGPSVQTEPLQHLEREWAALYDRCPGATPFQSPEWLLPWWDSFPQGESWVLTMRAGGRLVGLAPLAIEERKAMLMGAGISDYLDVIAEPGLDISPFPLYLASHASHWDVCEFTPADRRCDIPASLVCETREEDVYPYLALPESPELFDSSLPPRMLRNLRRDLERLHKKDEVRFELAGRNNLDEFLEAFFRLHGARWSLRDQPGVLADERVRHFHRKSAPRLLDRGLLHLYGLRVGPSLAAVLYVLDREPKSYYYLGGFDPALSSFGPGSLLLRHAIHESIRLGRKEFDFMRGGEPYKYRWGAKDRALRRLILRPE